MSAANETGEEEDKWEKKTGKRKGEEERTNGRRRKGQGKRKGEEKREQQLLQVAESTWGYDKSLSALPGIEILSTTVTMGRSACNHLVTIYPSPLKDFFTGSNTVNFQDNIRQYNSAFSFASFKFICFLGLLATLYTKATVWRVLASNLQLHKV